MHPEYKRSRRKIRIVGTVAVVSGVLGIVLPVIPGLALILAGMSVLSLQSTTFYNHIAAFKSRHPELSRYVRAIESRIVAFYSLTTHTTEYIEIPRRDGNKLGALIELSPIHIGIAVLVHSATGTKETPLMNMCAEAFRARGYTVIRFDAYNGMGEQGGDFSAFTPTSMYDDLNDVLTWARAQEWWHTNLLLFGHSIGGLVVGHYIAEHPDHVHTAVLFAPTASGDSYIRTYQSVDTDGMERWRADGTRTVHHPLSGASYAFPYEFVKDSCKYNLVTAAPHIHTEIHLLVGTRDRTAPESECRILAEAFPVPARLTVLTNLPHTPIDSSDIATLYNALLSV